MYDAPAAPFSVPPVDAVYHPLKVYPDFVAVGRVMLAPLEACVRLAVAQVPPLVVALNVTV